MSGRRTVLWWGRFDPDYSRNRILRVLFADLGWEIVDFKPRFSRFADLEIVLQRIPKVDLVWVPCFRQRDIAAARRWSQRMRLPLVVDPLISTYDKQVFERSKFKPGSYGAEKVRDWEGGLLRSAGLVVIDTPAHADFFAKTFAIPRDRIKVIHVGAEGAAFRAAPMPEFDGKRPLEALFYGSFIGLQGPQVIVEAARLYRGRPLRWVLLGEGPLRGECERLAQGLENVFFENLPFDQRPARIHQADILLGVFGASAKAGRVIPNKVFQSLASARPVVTREAEAYPDSLLEVAEESGLVFVPPDDPRALAETMAALASDPEHLGHLARRARSTFERFFSADEIRAQLREVLDAVMRVGR